jgi:hypothetical protein
MVRFMDEIISYKMCAVKVCNAKLRNYLKHSSTVISFLCLFIFAKLNTLNFFVVKKKLCTSYYFASWGIWC